ncbi:T9SS type A sorting domain-containing protein [candidate division KSB1 bacterium]|nr:T9SS type A sorting domain-containing protein [candidate division KSB1 bacterium]
MKKFMTMGMLLLFGIALSGFYLEKACAQNWLAAGSRPQDYEMGGNPTVSHGSENAGFIRSKVNPANGFGTWMTKIEPGSYLGKGLKLSAYVKTANVINYATLWMRVDGAGNQTLSFDNMAGRPIIGTTDWQQYEIILDVPENSTGIFFGIMLGGTDEAWVDGLRLETTTRTWAAQNSGISVGIRSIKAVDENTVWAGAAQGIYLRTIDGGENWTSGTVSGAESLDFYSIAAIDQNTAYFMGQNFTGGDGRIYKTTDDGANWTLQYRNTSPGVFFNSIAFWDEAHGIAVSDPVNGSFLIVTTSDSGNTWNQVPAKNIPTPLPNEFAGITGNGGTSLAVEGTNNAWFGTGFSTANGLQLRVLRTTDQGQHWTAINTPLSTFGGFRGIQTIAFKDSLTGFAGSVGIPNSDITNTLVKTIDGGKSWEVVSSFLPIYPSTLVYVPQTNNSVLFVTSLQGASYSEDGGTTWKSIISTQIYYPMTFASPTGGWGAGFSGRIGKFIGNLTTDIIIKHEQRPEGFELSQNYPNPFNPITTIAYSIPQADFVELKIYNMLGREIQTLVSEMQQAGNYTFDFDASQLSNGVYFYQLKVGNRFSETRKMLLLQ